MTLADLISAMRRSESEESAKLQVAMDSLLEQGFSVGRAASAMLGLISGLRYIRRAYPSHPKNVAHSARVVFVEDGKVRARARCGAWDDDIVEVYHPRAVPFAWGNDVPRRGQGVEVCGKCFPTSTNGGRRADESGRSRRRRP